MPRAKIVGLGMYVPPRVVTNEELSQWMKTSPEWIEERTGIQQRHWIDSPAGPSDLAIPAADEALARAGWDKESIDMVIFGTLSPDHFFPGSGCVFQEKYGLGTTPALDIRNQCSAFLYGLSVAKQFCASGTYKRILLIGAETHSTGLDITSEGRNVSVIFGDGAGAACIESVPDDSPAYIDGIFLHADGGGRANLTVAGPSTVSHPLFSYDDFNRKIVAPHMDGPVVFRHAITRLDEVAHETLDAHGLQVDDIDLVVPHQANMRINAMVAARLGIPEEKVVHNIQKYGNTTAASIPIALHEAEQEGRLKQGDTVLLLAFGAGFTWGGAILHW